MKKKIFKLATYNSARDKDLKIHSSWNRFRMITMKIIMMLIIMLIMSKYQRSNSSEHFRKTFLMFIISFHTYEIEEVENHFFFYKNYQNFNFINFCQIFFLYIY